MAAFHAAWGGGHCRYLEWWQGAGWYRPGCGPADWPYVNDRGYDGGDSDSDEADDDDDCDGDGDCGDEAGDDY